MEATSLPQSVNASIKFCYHNFPYRVFYGPNPDPFSFISSFYQCNDEYSKKIDHKSVDGVLGIRTLDRRMVGGDKSPNSIKSLGRRFVGNQKLLIAD